jgi:hypothetical protein
MRLDRKQGTGSSPPGGTAGGKSRVLPLRGRRPRPTDFDRAYEEAFDRLSRAVEEAVAREPAWPRQVAAAIRALLAFAAEDPTSASTLTHETLARGGEQIARYRRLVEFLAAVLAPGRDASPTPTLLPELLEEAIAGGTLMLIGGRLAQNRQDELPGLVAGTTEFALTSYLGQEQARLVAAESEPRGTAVDS